MPRTLKTNVALKTRLRGSHYARLQETADDLVALSNAIDLLPTTLPPSTPVNPESITLANYADSSTTMDNSTGISRWLADVKASGLPGCIPPGTFLTSDPLFVNSSIGLEIYGAGMDQSIIKGTGLASDEDLLTIDCLQNLILRNFRLTSDGSGRNGLAFQHTGPTTSVRHKFQRLHISNFLSGAGFVANNMELSKLEQVYIYGCLDGLIANNTGNGSGNSASCVSNRIEQVRVLNCRGKGMEFQNWAMSTLDHVQVLQCGKTIAGDGSVTMTPGHVAQVVIAGSCNGFTVIHPDIEEYRDVAGVQTFDHLTNGIQFSGTNHKLEIPNLFGLNTPWKAVSANDFIVEAPRIVQCLGNGVQDSSSTRMVAIIPRQLTAQGGATIIGGGGSGYANSPANISTTGTTTTFKPPKMTTAQRDALVGVSAGDEIFNSTVNKKQFYNGTAWETITSA